jgi:hypothetical protein
LRLEGLSDETIPLDGAGGDLRRGRDAR